MNKLRLRPEAALEAFVFLHICGDAALRLHILSAALSAKALAAGMGALRSCRPEKADAPAELARQTAEQYRKYDKGVCAADTARQGF